MSSAAFGSKKRPAGKQYRNGGVVADALDDIYKDVEAGFVAVEKRLNQSAVDQRTVMGLAVGVFDSAATDPAGASNKTKASHAFGPTLPIGAVITRAWYFVNTTFQSTNGGTDKAEIALGVAGATGGLVTAVAIETGTPWDADAGLIVTAAAGVVANFVPNATAGLTVAGTMLATVTAQPLTAGKLTVYAEYIVLQS